MSDHLKNCLRCNGSVNESLLYCKNCAQEYALRSAKIEAIFEPLVSKAEEWVSHLKEWQSSLEKREVKLLQQHKAFEKTWKVSAEVEALLILQHKAINTTFDFLGQAGFEALPEASQRPKKPGIYLIYGCTSDKFSLENAECLYVGKARSLASRLGGHGWMKGRVRQDYPSIQVFYKTFSGADFDFDPELLDRELLITESLYIGLLRPTFNFGLSRRIEAIAGNDK